MLTARFDTALAWASELHREQTRKGSGTPYISHLLAVTALVLEAGGDEDEAIAAVLHDAIEDQGGHPTREAIRQRFGDRVTALVDGCTDADVMPKPPWLERKQAFIASIAEAPPSVRLIVSADKLHNIQCSIGDLEREGDGVWERFRGREKALWYYRSVVEALESAGPNPLQPRLRQALARLESL
ncbi:MAG: HD domain-containing protein [Acidobacteria bacterium]|nr:HD domain-containing protein [Acidobacteriota bacterium]